MHFLATKPAQGQNKCTFGGLQASTPPQGQTKQTTNTLEESGVLVQGLPGICVFCFLCPRAGFAALVFQHVHFCVHVSGFKLSNRALGLSAVHVTF